MEWFEKFSHLILNYDKKLVKLPKWMGKLKSLTMVDVGGCGLDCFPKGMGWLDKLNMLYLKDNKRLVKILKCMGKMKLLTGLMGENKLH
jgi:hypothetical protein